MQGEPIYSFEELQQAYFRKCRQTDSYLQGISGVKGLSKDHFVLIGYEDGQPPPKDKENTLQPIAIADAFFWPAVSTFLNRPLTGEVERIMKNQPSLCDGVISGGIH